MRGSGLNSLSSWGLTSDSSHFGIQDAPERCRVLQVNYLRHFSRRWFRPAVLGALVAAICVFAAVPSASGRGTDLPGYPERPDLITLEPLSQTNWVGEEVTHT